jgi:hypothetical protein
MILGFFIFLCLNKIILRNDEIFAKLHVNSRPDQSHHQSLAKGL